MMSASGPANAQARNLLRTLGRFIITLAKSIDTKDEKDVDDLMLGVEATEFVAELEKFLLSSHNRKKERSLEVRAVNDPFRYLEGTDWFWETPYAGGEDRLPLSPLKPNESSAAFEGHSEQDAVLYKRNEIRLARKLRQQLDLLQHSITTSMPIRILHFEPVGVKLKISLFDRNAVYQHLSQKLRDDFKRQSVDNEWQERHTKYAILSHTWNQAPGELTYNNWHEGPLDAEDPKCQKLVNFCRAVSENHGLDFGWIDTICINKESSAELDESIRSMYKWYRYAAVCITYLGKTNSLFDMVGDPWFTRGWTFQELVAPYVVKFYNKDWEQLVPSVDNDKQHPPILQHIELATEITRTELENIREVSISRRMELAAQRKVTCEEDTAYSLMGIFDVSISTAYGEGQEHAFFRLLKEIFDTNKDISDIFNWGNDLSSSITSLFPETIGGYIERSTNPALRSWRPIEPLTLTHLGLRTPILLMAAELCSELHSPDRRVGDYYATVSLQLPSWWGRETYCILQTSDLTTAIGVLNVEDHNDETSIRISKTCFAVLLKQEQYGLNNLGRYKKQDTWDPIVFTLGKVVTADDDSTDYFVVKKDQLENHGMKLVTLYL